MRKFQPIAFSLLCFFSHGALADEDALKLKLERAVNPAPKQQEATPLFIEAETIEGRDEEEITAQGAVVMRRLGQTVFADRLTYRLQEDEIEVEGNVRLEQHGDLVQGPKGKINLERETGFFDTPDFFLQEKHGRGNADKLFLEGPQQYRLEQAYYTTCPVGNDDWYIKAGNLKIDQTENIGTAKDASIVFKGVPILYTPWINFPVGDNRKSGFLTPSFGSTGNSGFEFTLPYYWNIAPNYDATFSARGLSKRGAQLSSEFRYLNPAYFGEARVELLPDDQLKQDDRYALLFKHSFSGNGYNGSLNFQRVSDDSYFRDLSTRIAFTSQVNLPREALLTYAPQPWWNATIRAQSFQTLQDPLAPQIPPYRRLPQLTLNGAKQNIAGLDLSMGNEFVNFDHPSLVTGTRFTAYPSISLPLQTSFAYFTPKIGGHYTHYSLNQNTTTLPDTNRLLPISSVETGLIFERGASFFGQSFTQTVEPKLYYLNIPFRDQSQIPNFDTAFADINFAQIFTENQFSGGDRINNANQLTVGITSRLLSDNGDERLRFNIGQRLLFVKQQVTLNSTGTTTPANDPSSNILATISSRLSSKWLAEAGLQYRPSSSTGQKFGFGVRYQPETGKVLNLGYRFVRDSLEQVDISSQWPLGGGWYGLGRYNYSLRDRQTLEALLGFEYNSCCWTLRLVGHRFATATQAATTGVFIQLELNGLSKIGSNPLEVLRQNISGYTKTNQPFNTSEPYQLR
ncbi:MAG TPA: LPS-assembly protein LptD [Burkholderiales bacterium]|nr:LPS-assembly protein LptD [Burkholderiales bacterium]